MFGETKMKTEAQIIRELMESLLHAGPVKLEDIYDVEEDEQPQAQYSTYDQLLETLDLATQAGLYDAADWLKDHLRQMQANFKK